MLSCFTPRYCSPQMLQDDIHPVEEDAPNDMWALGVILHRLLSIGNKDWEHPFGPTTAELASIAQQPLGEQQPALKACIMAHQSTWVSFC